MSKQFMRQVEVKRHRAANTDIVSVAWIPDNFAYFGNTIDLKEEDGNWTKGWQITKVFAKEPTSVIAERERDYMKTRKASDI